MKPRYTDEHRYPRGYVRSESTDVGKTWAAARRKTALAAVPRQDNVRKLKQAGGAR